ncbi:hypothetical protein FPSE5266_06962 [Fusarium pseudograminearum]|uniref:WGS project CBME000000000 data, contig CS3487_c000035 n=1 Tax=Fusarium pseudograminearum CS3487 TaxID=1318458 RepID=A0A096PCW1_FUSPS|nr:hypothetical protein FPSE5266_06962 [Fusarium pseudograminearum]CEG02569.1 unnamed protein product [Fusarium pseudograminearum CS3487]
MAESSMDELIYSLSLLSISRETQEEQYEVRHEENTHEENNEASPEVTKIEPATEMTDSAPQKSSMYPELHGYVAESLGEELEYTFRDHDTKVDIKRQHDTSIFGDFTCGRVKCDHHFWHSNCIAITIREYDDESYNVLVYHQLCSTCKKPTRADLDKPMYGERVAYNLKKWNGIHVKQVERKVDRNGDHKEHLCQGCIKGHCKKRKSRLRI